MIMLSYIYMLFTYNQTLICCQISQSVQTNAPQNWIISCTFLQHWKFVYIFSWLFTPHQREVSMYSHYTTLWILIQTLKKATFVYNTIFSSHNSQVLSLLSKSSSQSIQVIFKSTQNGKTLILEVSRSR